MSKSSISMQSHLQILSSSQSVIIIQLHLLISIICIRASLVRLEPRIHNIDNKTQELHSQRLSIEALLDQRSHVLEPSVNSLQSDVTALQSSQQLVPVTMDRLLTRHTNVVQESITGLLVGQQRLELKVDILEAARLARAAEDEARQLPPSSSISLDRRSRPGKRSKSTSLQISMSFSHSRCAENCVCVCHEWHKGRTPRFFERFFGALLFGYTGLPYLERSCDSESCDRRAAPLILLTYFFPRWLVARAFLLAMRYSLLQGPELVIRVPRLISSNSRILTEAVRGNVDGVKDLFRRGLASPIDINVKSGQSALLVRRPH